MSSPRGRTVFTSLVSPFKARRSLAGRHAAVLERVAAAHAATRERFELAQEVGGIGTWDWDIVNDEGRVSDSYKRMHGLAHVQGPLRIAQVLAVIHPEDLPGYTERLAAAKLKREASVNDYRVVHPDGSICWVAAKGRPLFDPEGRLIGAIGIVMDVTERKQAEERAGLLSREIDHRANNLMAVVQSTVRLSRAEDAAGLREVILGRVEALARAHQLLADSRWQGADLRLLAEDELRPFTYGEGARVRIEGESRALSPAAAQSIAMVLHELATNAAKHGALSTPAGRVDLSWAATAGRLHLRWAETGGPAVRAPERRGFGTTVLERALAGGVGGASRLDWRESGLVCELELPLGSELAVAAERHAAE